MSATTITAPEPVVREYARPDGTRARLEYLAPGDGSHLIHYAGPDCDRSRWRCGDVAAARRQWSAIARRLRAQGFRPAR